MKLLISILALAYCVSAQMPPTPPSAAPPIQWQSAGDTIDYGTCLLTPVTSNDIPYGLIICGPRHWAAPALVDTNGHVYGWITQNWPKPAPIILPQRYFFQSSIDLVHWQTIAELTNDLTMPMRMFRLKQDTQP